ncbi:hypothetical protein JCM18903_2355 [Psychrobacter sp. JCM 18903]|uniref:hypothetical protein n=1 Tax=Psychrobacter sp. JCM 18903 TaxID=1298610 RepID=UPI000432B6E9|nr:hypothetical protein [Psychrobacter sp. JCM 18903]GAF62287.1 hypothetical protein JCM18903_2355 [Psychrobacter sp. JCM 18903]
MLQLFCYLSYFESKFSWDSDFIFEKFKIIKSKSEIKFENQKILKDLSSAVALWTEDNGLYSFAHRSLQEYFASLFVKQMTLESKEIVYKKILSRFKRNHFLFETDNFLSLLEEMDELEFNKLYHLPLLLQIRDLLDFSSSKSLYLSFLRSSFSKIRVDDEYKIVGGEVGNGYSKLASFKINYLHKLHSVIAEAIKNINKENLSQEKAIDGGIHWELLLLNELPKEFVDTTYEEVLRLANLYKKYLFKEIEKTESFIEKSEKNDIDFADLI